MSDLRGLLWRWSLKKKKRLVVCGPWKLDLFSKGFITFTLISMYLSSIPVINSSGMGWSEADRKGVNSLEALLCWCIFSSGWMGHCSPLFRQRGNIIELGSPRVLEKKRGCFVWLFSLSSLPHLQSLLWQPEGRIIYSNIHKGRESLGHMVCFLVRNQLL